MSASRRCSTGSSAASWRLSMICPGVTRDRREGAGHIADLAFRLIDTAGLEEAPPTTLAGRMRAQTERSLDVADVVLLVIDARDGRDRGRPPFRAAGCGAAASRSFSSPTRPRAVPRWASWAKPMRSASASRWRSRRSTARASPSCTSGSSPFAAPGEDDEAPNATRTCRRKNRCSWRSSAGRMSASRRWSTGWSATTGC